MKHLIKKAGQLSYFLLVSIPLASMVYFVAIVISETKRLITFIKQ